MVRERAVSVKFSPLSRSFFSSQTESIEALSASYTAQRKLTHDFNAHLATLSSYLDNGQIKDAQDYITTLQERQTDRILIANTHNSTIDALLNQKAQVAKRTTLIFVLRSMTFREYRSLRLIW